MNRDWHQQHKMPERATAAERIAWHIDHARNCGCRPIPKQLLEKVERIQRKKHGVAAEK
jgi:hypothetical protein